MLKYTKCEVIKLEVPLKMPKLPKFLTWDRLSMEFQGRLWNEKLVSVQFHGDRGQRTELRV
jgi:hypothetical protein